MIYNEDELKREIPILNAIVKAQTAYISDFKLKLEAEYKRGQASILSRSCEVCKYLEDRSSIFYTPTHLAKYRCSHPLMNVSDGNSDLTYVGLTFMCNRWEAK